MAKRKGNYVAGPGRNPLYNEEMVHWKTYIPKSYREHIRQKAKDEGMSMNGYLCLLIEGDMDKSDEKRTPVPLSDPKE